MVSREHTHTNNQRSETHMAATGFWEVTLAVAPASKKLPKKQHLSLLRYFRSQKSGPKNGMSQCLFLPPPQKKTKKSTRLQICPLKDG